MGFSNLVALAIIVTTAATLHTAGVTNIETSAQAAQALRPVAGSFAIIFFGLGIVGTGLLSVPVLAGSAAYALGEIYRWRVGLNRQPMEAKAFYAAVALATMTGVAINFSLISPIKALYWMIMVGTSANLLRMIEVKSVISATHSLLLGAGRMALSVLSAVAGLTASSTAQTVPVQRLPPPNIDHGRYNLQLDKGAADDVVRAMYLITQTKHGISSIELSRRLSTTQTTAWKIKTKLA